MTVFEEQPSGSAVGGREHADDEPFRDRPERGRGSVEVGSAGPYDFVEHADHLVGAVWDGRVDIRDGSGRVPVIEVWVLL